MEYYFYILIVALGLCWGSFLTVVIWRIDDLRSIFVDRSRCTQCKREIRWYDLAPLISYSILRGRCRYCKEKIPLLYPIIELIMGALTLLIFMTFGFSWASLVIFIIFSLLVVTLGYDILHMMIIDTVVWTGVVLAILWQFLMRGEANWVMMLIPVGIGALIGFGIPLILVIVSHGKWMGEGDVGLGLMVGVLLGYPNVLVAYITAFITGAICGIILVGVRGRNMKDAIPFGPFLVIGALVAFFAGDSLVDWYLKINYLK